jgi:hypothetical protein
MLHPEYSPQQDTLPGDYLPVPSEAPGSASEREAAVSELYGTFVKVTTSPLANVIPNYPRGDLGHYYDPYIIRNEVYDSRIPAGVTFLVGATEAASPYLTREDMRLLNPVVPLSVQHPYHEKAGKTIKDILIEEITGKEVIGTVVDFEVNPADNLTSLVSDRYILVRTSGDVDVLRLPAELSENQDEQEMIDATLERVQPKAEYPDSQYDGSWPSPSLLRQTFGHKFKPAALEDIQQLSEKLKGLITNYPLQSVRK